MKKFNGKFGFSAIAVGAFALALGLAACGENGMSSTDVSYGTMTDARDGQVYKTVKIGVQTWMAENLNYDYNVGSAKSFCYDNKSKNCDKYGRLYLWPAAMDSAGLFSKTGLGCGVKAVDDNKYGSSCDVNGVVQGVCPDGWHLPSVEEYAYLMYSVAQYYDKDHFAGRVLEAKKGWPSHYKQGTDNLGFTALPAGQVKSDGLSRESIEFSGKDSLAVFWTTNFGREVWLSLRLGYFDYGIYGDGYVPFTKGFSVRCVSDEYSEEIEDDLCVPSDSNIVKDTIVDSRDGQVYSIVTIGEQTWMAQNLNYDNGSGYAGCFEYDINNCKKYGRLYSKTGDGLSGDKANRIQLCPQGWHVPNNEEWNTLFDFVGGADSAGQYLKSSCYWKNGEENRDRFGFSVLPAGHSYIDNALHTDGFNVFGKYASFWSISETCDVENDFWDEEWDEFYYVSFDEHQGVEVSVNEDEVDSRYIRCIKDDPGSSSSVASSSSSPSSSSVILSSSSEGTSIKDGSKYDASANTLTDLRDNQVYKTVTIGSQTWMAENLNYAYTGVKYNYSSYTSDSTSWCYENKASNCDKYGRLYTWSAVMDSAAQFSVNAGTKCGYGKTCTPNSPHRGICPEGWHVPTNVEYSTLYAYIGGSSTAGSLLKSTSGWNDYYGKSGNGTDKYGFSVLPVGYRRERGHFLNEGYLANLWSASEYSSYGAWYQNFRYDYDYALQNDDYKTYGRSLRCLKD